MKKWFVLFLIFSSCSFVQQTYGTLALATRRQKHKTSTLQRKLNVAQRKVQESQDEADRLRLELCEAELNSIETDLDSLEQKWQLDPERFAASLQGEVLNLFLEEREMLHTIIELDPTSVRAQLLLDRFLQLITQLSDTKRYSESSF